MNKREDEAKYESTLEAQLQNAAVRRIPMLVTNPDKIRPDVERPPMPGKIADRYEQILRRRQTISEDECKELVKRVGKPFRDVYELALEGMTTREHRSRVCMVGDALETDIVGGASSGIVTVWVLLDGIYGPDLDAAAAAEDLVATSKEIVQEFNTQTGTYAGDRVVTPDIVLRHFRW